MNEKLVRIMEKLSGDWRIKSSMNLSPFGKLDIYLWEGDSIARTFSIKNARYITENDVEAVSAMIEAYKKNLSLPAKQYAEI